MEAIRQWSDLFSLHELELPKLPAYLKQIFDQHVHESDPSSSIEEAAAKEPFSTHDFAVKYFPVLLVLFLFWPVVLTLIMTVTSASTWVFWLFTSVIFGVVQLGYVLHQFFMVLLDLLMLSVLKTFATLRSQIRYYTIRSGLRKGSRGRSRRGRRREWKKKLDVTSCYEEYLNIELREPEQIQQSENNDTTPSTALRSSLSEKVRARRTKESTSQSRSKLPPIRPPGTEIKKKKRQIIDAYIKKSKSCVNFEADSHTNGVLSRTTSSENMQRKSSSPTMDEDGKAVEREIGMAGAMLQTTFERLQEARSQASLPTSLASQHSSESPLEISKHPVKDDGKKYENERGDPDSRRCDGFSSLKFLLTGVVKRNHLSVDDLLIDDANSVAECGRHRLSEGARALVKGYNEEVDRCLDFVAEAPVQLSTPTSSHRLSAVDGDWLGSLPDEASSAMERQGTELSDRIFHLRKLKQNMGRSALMLSGGGAQAMYHLGIIRALAESGVYKDIKVISGTSGGSISAAMCAIKTTEELLRDVCVRNVSTDYMLDGTMKRENIRWFPKLVDMGATWLKSSLLVESSEFKRCCDFYFGDTTFEEAFERTGKHVCITVSASRSGSGAQRLLLNHISTPHVTIASAVGASCALPGVMAPAKLQQKNARGTQEPFEVDGVEWIDGSVQADLPFKRISTLFNVSNFIVSQTNFHVVPFLHKAHHPGVHSMYWRAFQMCEWDIRSRVLNLSRLGLVSLSFQFHTNPDVWIECCRKPDYQVNVFLHRPFHYLPYTLFRQFPKVFGHDISKVFKQKYHGNLTLVPRFTTMQLFGLKALVNPTVEDMKIYLKNGQIAAWPYLT